MLAPDEEQIRKALISFREAEHAQLSLSYFDWMNAWIQAARQNFPAKSRESFKTWISPETIQLISQRTLAAHQGDTALWAALNKMVKKTPGKTKEPFSSNLQAQMWLKSIDGEFYASTKPLSRLNHSLEWTQTETFYHSRK